MIHPTSPQPGPLPSKFPPIWVAEAGAYKDLSIFIREHLENRDDEWRAALAIPAPEGGQHPLQAACRYISDVLASDATPSEKHIARCVMHLLPLVPEPAADKRFSWMDFQLIGEVPAVDEAMRALLDDQTEDNATCLIRAVVEAAGDRLAALAAQPQADQQSQFCPICEARGRADQPAPAEAPVEVLVTRRSASMALNHLANNSSYSPGALAYATSLLVEAASKVQPKGMAPDWRRVVGRMARALDQCADNADPASHPATMREVATRLTGLLTGVEFPDLVETDEACQWVSDFFNAKGFYPSPAQCYVAGKAGAQAPAPAPALTDMQIDKLLHALDDVALNFGDDLPGLALNSRGLERSREVVRKVFADGTATLQTPAVGAGDERQDVGGHIRAAANARVAQQADDDTRRLDYLQKKQATISLVPDGRDEKGTRHAFMVGGWHCSVNRDVRASIDAAMGESQPPVQGSQS